MASSIINTNIAAIRTHNVYNRNNDYMNAAMTRVATGMKINSAKDGASTWAISEKMRERMRANDQANQNVQNDTAMLKTAEGGIGNTIDILKTLKERAVNAANDSNLNSDRAVIQQEIDELIKQINDNATKVKFNGRTLLNGAADSDTAAATSNVTVDTTGVTAPTAATSSSVTGDKAKATHSVYEIAATAFRKNASGDPVEASTKLTDLKTSATGNPSMGIQDKDVITMTWTKGSDTTKYSATFTVDGANSTFADLYDISKWTAADGSNTSDLYLASLDGSSTAANITFSSTASDKVQYDVSGTATDLTTSSKGIYVVGTGTTDISSLSFAVTRDANTTDSDGNITAITRTTVGAAQTALQPTAIAATTDDGSDGGGSANLPTSLTYSNALKFHIGGEKDFSIDMKFAKLDDEGLGIKGLSVASQGAANSAIEAIDNALNLALKEQTRVGAYENRLGYASDNLTTMNENLEAADSVMRDSDIAKEMTNYMKYAVLSQASQYMLAQAGQNAFQVLNLLQQ